VEWRGHSESEWQVVSRSTSPSDVFRKSPPCVRLVDLRSFSHFSREQPRALLLQTPAKDTGDTGRSGTNKLSRDEG
jgi:hypothetical protein